MSIIFTKCNFFNTLRFFVKILTTVFILMSYLLLSGCGNNKSDNYSKADNKNSTVTTAVDNNTVTGDTAKTGTEDLAGSCLILLEKDLSGNPYISIVMGAPDKTVLYNDMTSLISAIPAS